MPALPARRLLLLPLLLGALVPALAPAPARAAPGLRLGVIDNAYATSQPTAFWADAERLRVGIVRWDLQWRSVAPTEPANPRDPADPAYDWAATDAFVRAAARQGLRDHVLLTVWRTPSWASSMPATGGTETHMPRVAAWRDFAHAAALRYSGAYTPPGQAEPLPRVRLWETWNEPNARFAFRPQYAGGRPVSPRNYVVLLHTLRRAVRATIPDARFVAGALYKQGGAGGVAPLAFLRGMRRAGATFDVLSIHPYNNVPRLGLRDGRDQSTSRPSFIGIGNFDVFIRLANRILGRRYPIWVTEFGWATPAPGKQQYTVDVAQQAAFLAGSIRRFRALPQVEAMIWFLIVDERPRTGAWYTTGLRRADGSPKPSWDRWIAAAARRSPARLPDP